MTLLRTWYCWIRGDCGFGSGGRQLVAPETPDAMEQTGVSGTGVDQEGAGS